MNEQKQKVAVVLSGCGVFDGTEIHEAVLTLLAIEEEGATWHCFAPNIDQMHVIDHSTGEVQEGVTRNVFTESARIARGADKLSELAEYDPAEFDAIVFPGGFARWFWTKFDQSTALIRMYRINRVAHVRLCSPNSFTETWGS